MRALFVDLDGTVLDTGALILSSWRHVRDRFGYPRTGDVLQLTITPAGDAMSAR